MEKRFSMKNSHHIHKFSIDEHITDSHAKHEPSKFSLEEMKKTESQGPEEGFLCELLTKIEILSLELRKMHQINEELLIENELWKEQYQKLQHSVASAKEQGEALKMHDIYQQNFITTLNSMENELNSKENKLAHIGKNIKIAEKENLHLKKELENSSLKAGGGSPTVKKDLLRKIEDLEKMNFHLNNELDQASYEKKKNLLSINSINNRKI